MVGGGSRSIVLLDFLTNLLGNNNFSILALLGAKDGCALLQLHHLLLGVGQADTLHFLHLLANNLG